MNEPHGRKLPYDGGANALAIGRQVQKIWRIGEKPTVGGPPLFSRHPIMCSLMLAAIFGQNNGDGRLRMPDPSTGEEVLLPRD